MKKAVLILVTTLMSVSAFAFNSGVNPYQKGNKVAVDLVPGSSREVFKTFLGLPLAEIKATTTFGHAAYILCVQAEKFAVLGVEIRDGNLIGSIPILAILDRPLAYTVTQPGQSCKKALREVRQQNHVEMIGATLESK